MKETLFAVSSKTDSTEKHFATKADLATTQLNFINDRAGLRHHLRAHPTARDLRPAEAVN